MKKYLFLLLMAGCAETPISETVIPPADIAHCTKLSEGAMKWRAVERGTVEAARATGVAYGITQIVPTISIATVLPYIAAGYAITSAVNGQIEAQDRRDAIVRECLRDKGYKVY